MAETEPRRIAADIAGVLAANRIVVGEHRYTAPSLDDAVEIRKDYANQFQWDSCFHALGWRWIDPAMAEDELLALVSRSVADGPDAGMIPHCNYWRGGGAYLWGVDHRSLITQTPLIAIAALLVHDKSGSATFLERVYGPLGHYHDWFDRRRDPDGDGLVTMIHPWESGGDALPRWDAALGLANPTYTEAREARLALAKVVVDHEADAVALGKAGYFHVAPVDFNAIRGADLAAMGGIAARLGRTAEAAAWRERAARVRTAIRTHMLFDGEPYDLSGPGRAPIRMASAGQFMALIDGAIPPAETRRLIARLREPRFWTRFPVTTSPTDDPTFAPDVYWRGNVWPSVNWLVYEALVRTGEAALARELAQSAIALMAQSGLREYYNPVTGGGLGGVRFSWTAAFLDMIKREGLA